MKEYKKRKGAKFKEEEAQWIGEELEKIRKKNKGFITPEKVVESAKDKKSKLHKHFEWNNSKAGYQYRLQQARNLVSGIVEIVVIDDGKEEMEVRSFYNVHIKDLGTAYVSLKDVTTNRNYRRELLSKALVTLENLTKLIKMLREEL